MSAEPVVPAWITSKYLTAMFQNFLRDDSVQVEDFTTDLASLMGDNYACYLFRIKVGYSRQNKKESRTLIAKLIPNSETSIELTAEYGFSDMYNTEIKMYSETLELIYEELSGKGKTERFFPRLYKMSTENSPAVLFMEDLVADGYVLADRKKSLDLDHTLSVIDILAKMHASSYLLLQKYPDHKNRYLHHEFKKTNRGFLPKLTDSAMHHTIKSLHLWPISEEDKNIIRNFHGKVFDLSSKIYERKESSFNVLIHGDCWVNNIMFKYNNGNIVSLKLIDYQFSNYNSIGLDLNYFLFTSAKEHVILEHLQEVFEAYYNSFVSVTGEIEGFTMDIVQKEFFERLEFGFLVGMPFRCIILSEKPFDAQALFQESGQESEINAAIFRNEEYIMEAVKLLPIFKEHGVFKL